VLKQRNLTRKEKTDGNEQRITTKKQGKRKGTSHSLD